MLCTDKVKLAVAVTLLINVPVVALPIHHLTYDLQTHLLFADHYRAHWLEPVNDRWFEGFCVWSYAPLAHQLIALIGIPLGEQLAYRLVLLLALAALPVIAALLAKEMFNEETAGFVALLTPLVSGIYMVAYCFGQLPTIVGMVLALGAAVMLCRFLKSGKMRELLGWAAFVGAAAATHHHSVLLVLPILSLALVASHCLTDWTGWSHAWKRPVVAAGVAAVTIAVALLPFWWWFFFEQLPQAKIPHPAREGFFDNPKHAQMFFWNLYGGAFAFLLLGATPGSLKQKAIWPLWAAILLLAVLGLGTVTPIPHLLFGRFADWLTYERFTLWAALLSVFPAGLALASFRSARIQVGILAVLALGSLFFIARSATFPLNNRILPFALQEWEVAEIVKFLDGDGHDRWYYVTLGLGESDMARVSRATALARNLDGFYFTARRRKELRESGVGTIDSAIYTESGQQLLSSILRHPTDWNLRWAVASSFRNDLVAQLRNAGWRALHTLGNPPPRQPADVVRSRVWIWQAPLKPPIPPIAEKEEVAHPRLLCHVWGTVPLFMLGLALVSMRRR